VGVINNMEEEEQKYPFDRDPNLIDMNDGMDTETG
jgi:hypothetical protein